MKRKSDPGHPAGWKPPRSGLRAKSVIPIGVRVGGRRVTPGCTLNVGNGGALLICSEDVPVGTEVEVTNLRSQEVLLCRVVWRAGVQHSGRFGLGVEILLGAIGPGADPGEGGHEEREL